MPAASASPGRAKVCARPSTTRRPVDRRIAPAIALHKVDLPAPFSPTSAWISPARTSKLTSARACTPAYSLPAPSTRRVGSAGVFALMPAPRGAAHEVAVCIAGWSCGLPVEIEVHAVALRRDDEAIAAHLHGRDAVMPAARAAV